MKDFRFRAEMLGSRLASEFSKENYLHTARFAQLHELAPSLSDKLDEASLLIGQGAYNRILKVSPTLTQKELAHLLIVGRSRAGKGLLIESQLYSWPHSVIVNDVKGELYQRTAGYRATLGKVYVVDPTGRGNKYDPLLGKYKDGDLQSAATNLLYDPDEKEKVFTKRAITMLVQLFLAARVQNEFLLPYVRQMVRLGLFGAVTQLYNLSHQLATEFLDTDFRHADLQDKFLLSSWGTLSAQMRKLLTEDTTKCFTGSDFTAKDIITSREPITVYLRWPERDLLSLSPLVHLIWVSLLDEMIYTYDNISHGRICFPVLALLDEIGRTGLPNLPEYSTTLAGRNISLLLAIQSLSQLDALYGKNKADVLRDNMDSQIFYRPASSHTAEYLENALGHKSGFAHSENKHGEATSEGTNEQRIPLMTAQMIKQMTDTEIIGFHRALPPFKAKRKFSDLGKTAANQSARGSHA